MLPPTLYTVLNEMNEAEIQRAVAKARQRGPREHRELTIRLPRIRAFVRRRAALRTTAS